MPCDAIDWPPVAGGDAGRRWNGHRRGHLTVARELDRRHAHDRGRARRRRLGLGRAGLGDDGGGHADRRRTDGAGGAAAEAGRGGRRGDDAGTGDAAAGRLVDELGDLLEHDLGVPRLGQAAVGADLGTLGGVERLRVAAQDDDGDIGELGVGLERLAQVVAGLARHHRVGEDERRLLRLGLGERVVDAARTDVLKVGGLERDLGDRLHGRAVVRDQDDLGHRRVALPSSLPW
jgi:hypothetical protein